VLLRILDDLDGDGIGDLALSDSSTWGNAGGQWLLFRGQRDGGYVYWGTLFFSPATLAIGPRPGDLTAWVRVAASRGSLQAHRLGSETITLERERALDLERPSDRAAYEATLAAGRRPAVEHCKLLAYRRDPAGCWRPGLGLVVSRAILAAHDDRGVVRGRDGDLARRESLPAIRLFQALRLGDTDA